MKVIFFGTPLFAVPTLEALAAEADLRPELVISQPSRPVGRGRKVQAPPVVECAERVGIPCLQPESVRDKEFLGRVREIEPDVAAVVAFGQIFRKSLLSLPRLGCVNLHGSLLPKYRGAAPIQASIAAGDDVTGVTTMLMERGLDSGPMLLKAECEIGPDETSAELAPRLASLGAPLMVETLRRLNEGTVEAEVQDPDRATFAPRLERSDAQVDWRLEASQIYNRWRGFSPWPGLASELTGAPVKLKAVRFDPGAETGFSDASEPGVFLGLRDGAMCVACGNATILRVESLQRPGKKSLAAPDFVNGERLSPGERFSNP